MRALALLLSLSAPVFAEGRVILPWGEPPPPRVAPVFPGRESLPRLYVAATFGVALPLAGLHVGPAGGVAAGYQTPWLSDHVVLELGVSALHSRRDGVVSFQASAVSSGVFLYDETRTQTEVLATAFYRAIARRGIEVSVGLGPDVVFGAELVHVYGEPFAARTLNPGAHLALSCDFRFLSLGDFVLQARLHATSDKLFAAARALQHVALEAGYRVWF